MNLYFRLMYLLVSFVFAKKREKLGKLTLTSRVWFNDIDINGHMNNGRYLTIMDLGRLQLVNNFGLFRRILQQHLHPIVAGASIVYLKSLKPFERFTLTTQIIYWDADWFYIRQDFYNSKSELSASALVRVAFVQAAKRIDSFYFLQGDPHMQQPEVPLYLSAFLAGEKTWINYIKASQSFNK